MKVVIAIDSFKGSGSSQTICELAEKGVKKVCPNAEVIKIPMADGGEGTVDAFLSAVGGEKHFCKVLDPLGREIEGFYGVLKDGTAVIEMAAASGLPLLSEEEKNPLKADTFGTGQLILQALNKGCKKIILGLGGSATNDGGAGMAKALGVTFWDNEGNELSPCPEQLLRISRVDMKNIDQRLSECEIIAACDVTNTLCGEHGASYVFAPQKGASGKDIDLLDKALFQLATVIERDYGIELLNFSGGGAAGGLGAGAKAFLNARLLSGIDIMLDTVNFESALADTDIVITGEGRIDGQSAGGKVPVGVARRTKKVKNIPVFALVGAIGTNASAVYEYGVDSIITTTDKIMTLEEAISDQENLIPSAAERLMRIVTAVTGSK